VIGGIPKIPKSTGQGRKGERRHGDAAIALALMWFVSQQEPSVVEYRSVAKRRFFMDAADDGAAARRSSPLSAMIARRRGAW